MYSNDVRKIAIRLYKTISSFRKVALIIGSSHSSIYRWLNNSDKPRKIQTMKLNSSKILDSITLYIKTHPFCSVGDVNKVLSQTYNTSVSDELVRLTIKKLCNFTKKRARYFSQPKDEKENYLIFWIKEQGL
jgi:transposase